MSRIGKNPITLPEGVLVSLVSMQTGASELLVKGPKGSLRSPLPRYLHFKQEANTLKILCDDHLDKAARSMYGTVRALLANNVKGVHEGWHIQLELVGVGYRAQVKGRLLVLSLGYSHDISYLLPEGISAEVKNQTQINLSSIDKQRIGQVASEIRAFRPPEPYKGKGIRFANEEIRRKAGKSGKATGKP